MLPNWKFKNNAMFIVGKPKELRALLMVLVARSGSTPLAQFLKEVNS